MTSDWIASQLNPQEVLTSEQQDALPLTCAMCDETCDRVPDKTECCECRDTSSYSGMKMNGGMAYCDECRERSNRQAERAQEKFTSDFYGGSEPQTINELSTKAFEEKEGLR